jgi:hypothetical protein
MIEHARVCHANQHCPRCGRPICDGCKIRDVGGEREHAEGHTGECVICGKMFEENEVELLKPDPNFIKIKITQRIFERYRKIELCGVRDDQ